MKDKSKRVAIISRESNEKTLDIAMLEQELLSRGCGVTVLSRLFKKEKSLKALGYIGHVMKQEAAILASDVVVLDTYCIPASMLPHRKGTKVVQMWHALGAVKKFGWQTVGKEGGSSERTAKLMKMHRGYDYVVCSSDVTAEHFCEAFKVDRSRIVKCGLPRIDYIKSVTSGERHGDTLRRIYAEYPQLRGQEKRTVLYAPTFRKGADVDAGPLLEALGTEKYNIVVKQHPVYRNRKEASADDAARGGYSGAGKASASGTAAEADSRCGAGEGAAVIFDEKFSSNDWLAAADIIISDYSSFVIESTLAEKPLFIYAYDLDRYQAENGLNMDFDAEPIAPYVFRDAKQLAEAACADYDFEALRAFRDRYIDVDTENCTAALADFIETL